MAAFYLSYRELYEDWKEKAKKKYENKYTYDIKVV